MVFHTGATRGFAAFVGFSPRAEVGLAVLAGARATRGPGFVRSAHGTLRTSVVRREAAIAAARP
ncbi:hypothetical protein ACH4E7_39525 [Kitasatospora sp. NPDC018058]|uniref:hypothetical protein n=1 Tax=Kitasatospora sp. NPDC018058 TaxID=3364025 RepID=UPI0037BFCB6B